mmetsp:Transcript_20602/g.29566  ORF Transcript_20602/g.29566 Transcript_20602/m.29566 type:complete len:262 (+) Transcript_20602:294-1079(+)
MRRSSLSESKAADGSSRINIGGSFMRARQSAILCLWPPESNCPPSPTWDLYPSGRVRINSWALTSRATRSISSKQVDPGSGAPYRIFSSTVPENKPADCSTTPTFPLTHSHPAERVSLPATKSDPAHGRYKPHINERRVDFPAPLRPTITVIDPFAAFKDIPDKTGTSGRDWYLKCKSLITTAAKPVEEPAALVAYPASRFFSHSPKESSLPLLLSRLRCTTSSTGSTLAIVSSLRWTASRLLSSAPKKRSPADNAATASE